MNLYSVISEGIKDQRTEPAIFRPAKIGKPRGIFLRGGWLKERNSNFIYG